MWRALWPASATDDYDKETYRNLRSLIEEEDTGDGEEEETDEEEGGYEQFIPQANYASASNGSATQHAVFNSISDTAQRRYPTMPLSVSQDELKHGYGEEELRCGNTMEPEDLTSSQKMKQAMPDIRQNDISSMAKMKSHAVRIRDTSSTPKMVQVSSRTKTKMSRITWKERRQEMDDIDPTQWTFPFKNLVFEGGGNKGIAHCGALQYLEEVGVMDQIKRVAGASAGSIMAALVAVGHTAEEIFKEMKERNMKDMFKDARWYQVPLNLFLYFGIHKSDGIYDWLGRQLADKVRKKLEDFEKKPKYKNDEFKKKLKLELKKKPEDITFEQVYLLFGKELCVVVTNLSRMTTEYCHPKTTPTLPVREAVRMSASLPGLFTAKTYRLYDDEDTFVDGGFLCNYPIHCFDGWYLSMDPKNTFSERITTEDMHKMFDGRFKTFDGKMNLETLGISLYADNEEDFLKNDLERIQKRQGEEETRPDTTLYHAWESKHGFKRKSILSRQKRQDCTFKFLQELNKNTARDKINVTEVEEALKKTIPEDEEQAEAITKQKRRIFGTDSDSVFTELEEQCKETDKNLYKAVVEKIDNIAMKLENVVQGWRRMTISNTSEYANGLLSTIMANMKKTYIQWSDKERTVGVNTVHVETDSFDLVAEDKDFLLERGKISCRRYLQYFKWRYPDLVKRKPHVDVVSGNEDGPNDHVSVNTETGRLP